MFMFCVKFLFERINYLKRTKWCAKFCQISVTKLVYFFCLNKKKL